MRGRHDEAPEVHGLEPAPVPLRAPRCSGTGTGVHACDLMSIPPLPGMNRLTRFCCSVPENGSICSLFSWWMVSLKGLRPGSE